MSTRATYFFTGSNTCLYIHHDGYEEGAANYFYNAFLVSGNVTAESMIRGNDRAEITGSHETHGDTEFRYTITGNTLKVEKGYGSDFKTVFTGDWVEFINQYVPESGWVDSFEPLQRIDYNYRKGVAHTPATLQAEIDSCCRQIGIWAVNGHTSGGNWDNAIKQLEIMRQYLTSYGTPKWFKND